MACKGIQMKKQLRILLAGALTVVPFAITIWVIISAGKWVDGLVVEPLKQWDINLYPGVGAAIMIAMLYAVGLLTHFWVFRSLVSLLEKFLARVPGARTVYESIRDLMKLFGGDAKRMGRTVLYTPVGTEMTLLAIMTNEKPAGVSGAGQDKVAIYVPYSYMFGGITIYVPRQSVREVDIPVEQALKLCATAQVSQSADTDQPAGTS